MLELPNWIKELKTTNRIKYLRARYKFLKTNRKHQETKRYVSRLDVLKNVSKLLERRVKMGLLVREKSEYDFDWKPIQHKREKYYAL